MPTLERPDGTTLHWEERGEGPLLVGAFACLAHPGVFSDLLDDLASDHRVVTYDPRGCGASASNGPYDMPTDEADLAALLEELGGEALVLSTGDATNRAVRVAARRPELVCAVVTPGGNPLGREVASGSEGYAASDSVIQMTLDLVSTDYRAALRMIVSSTNPQFDEEGVRRRVDEQAAYAGQDVTLARLRAWIGDAAPDEARALGDRLWILEHPYNPWFPLDMLDRTRELLPEAHVVVTDDGPLSRPDIAAGIIRDLTRVA
jgi:pimeloyl-ACP methyl ester carboxylesterase